jgi:hypothetical protein
MGDMADFYLEEGMLQYYESLVRDHEISGVMKNRVKRYDVTDEDIRDFLFEISVKGLCVLADKVLMDYYTDDSEIEMDKIINIAAFGLTKKYLTDKQKWCLGSFCLFWLREGKSITQGPFDEFNVNVERVKSNV